MFATTGHLGGPSPPTVASTDLLPKFTVDSYRNINGYSFLNDGKGYSDYTFDDLTRLYGADQTHISVDACGIVTFGLANCTVNTGIPDPLAYLELAIINEALPPDLGQCLGFSLSSARLSLAGLNIRRFPDRSQGPTVARCGTWTARQARRRSCATSFIRPTSSRRATSSSRTTPGKSPPTKPSAWVF